MKTTISRNKLGVEIYKYRYSIDYYMKENIIYIRRDKHFMVHCRIIKDNYFGIYLYFGNQLLKKLNDH